MAMTDREVDAWKMGYNSAMDEVRRIDTIRGRGKWEVKPLDNSEFKVVCSVCGQGEKAKGNGYTAYHFCPWCGADMRCKE